MQPRNVGRTFSMKGTDSTKIIAEPNAPNVNAALAILPNCDASARCISWIGPLMQQNKIGCGINVLAFMGEVDPVNATRGVTLARTSGQGTPFSLIVDWFNRKPIGFQYAFYEAAYKINTKQSLELFFDNIKLALPNNSCTIVKLNRSLDPRQRPPGLTPGHFILLSKEAAGEIWTFEPIYSTPGDCNKRQYKGVSDNFFRAYQNQGYETASVLMTRPIPGRSPMDIVGGDLTNMQGVHMNAEAVITSEMLEDLATDLKNATDCEIKGGIKRKYKRTKKSKNKKKKRKPRGTQKRKKTH